jgi:hypothetical protein
MRRWRANNAAGPEPQNDGAALLQRRRAVRLFPSFEDKPVSRKWNLWSYIDAPVGAQAVKRALAYDQCGFDIFLIANADTVMSRPSTELMARFFPETEIRAAIKGTHSLCSIDNPGLLRCEPQNSWRNSESA